MQTISRKIDKLGRIVLPMDYRKALGLEGEVRVVLGINGNAITTIESRNSRISTANQRFANKFQKEICRFLLQ